MKFYKNEKPFPEKTCQCQIRRRSSAHEEWTAVPKDEAPDGSVLWQIPFASKSLTSTETHYSNIETEALGILHDLK